MIEKYFPPYSKYKYSGVEWLGKIPQHWEVLPTFVVVKEQCLRYLPKADRYSKSQSS